MIRNREAVQCTLASAGFTRDMFLTPQYGVWEHDLFAPGVVDDARWRDGLNALNAAGIAGAPLVDPASAPSAADVQAAWDAANPAPPPPAPPAPAPTVVPAAPAATATATATTATPAPKKGKGWLWAALAALALALLLGGTFAACAGSYFLGAQRAEAAAAQNAPPPAPPTAIQAVCSWSAMRPAPVVCGAYPAGCTQQYDRLYCPFNGRTVVYALQIQDGDARPTTALLMP